MQVWKLLIEEVNQAKNDMGNPKVIWFDIRWKKWTPKSDKIERRRCQDERDSARKVHEGV
jgi:hypothetical protein